jgi:hypothetical protein|tara:strand:+ start:420 stop:674 length:255 start_codon:yes stop_codon:yes gene_type:complete
MNALFNKIVKDKAYYQFSCDDKKRPPTVATDKSFKLSEVNELNTFLEICNKLHLNYDLAIEEWIEEEQSIESSIYLINNNHKNS